jgi:hypothetical protein
MVVFVASGLISWRYFIFNPVSNRIKNRRTAPSGSYYPMVVKKTNPVSELKNILPVLNKWIPSKSTTNKEQSKYMVPFFIGRWYHFKAVRKAFRAGHKRYHYPVKNATTL